MQKLPIKKIFCILFLLVHGLYVRSQFNIDSLKNVLTKEKGDSANIIKWLKKTEMLSTPETEPLLVICNWGLENAKKIKNRYLEAHAYMSMGFSYLYTKKAYEEPVKHLTNALRISEADKYYDISAQAYNGLAIVYDNNKQQNKFEEYTLQSIEASKKIGLYEGIASGYNNLATLYNDKDEENMEYAKTAIEYQRLALEATAKMGDSTAFIIQYLNMSNYYSTLKQFDSAQYFLNTARVFIDALNAKQYMMHYFFNVGLMHYKQNLFTVAISDYQTSISYAEKNNAHGFKIKIYRALTKAFKKSGDFKNALHYYELTKVYDDSILNRENFAAAADIQNKYQREKKDKELLQKDLQLKTASQKRNRLLTLLITSFVVLTLLGIFSFLLLRNIKARKKAFNELEKRNEEIKEQAFQLSRQARLIAKFQSQMNPHFTFNALHSIYGLVIGNENEKAVTQIQSLAQLMRKTLTNSIREEITLEEEMDYLQRYIDFEKATSATAFDFKIQVSAALENVLIPPMMIQPFIENAIKHAGLDKVQNPFIKVLIEKENDLMMLIIEDNGQGLNSDNTNVNKLSHSMSIIKSRIELLFESKKNIAVDGYFKILSVPEIEKGTAIKFYLPLHYAY